jgi:Zn-dependent protease
MVACLVVAAAVAAPRPAEPLSWAPLALVVGTALSTLAHEAAHAWVARGLGYHVQGIVLGGLVGTTSYRGRGDRPLDRAAVALAGPAASAVLVLALVGALAVVPAGAAVAVEAGIALNAVAMVVNLVPVGGTDGAVFARSLAQHRRSARRPVGAPGPPRLAVPPTPGPTLVGDVPR